MKYEWDNNKAATNLSKHGVSFEEAKTELDDELRPEYDLKRLRVRKLGAQRKSFGDLVRLEPDVMEAFPNAEMVNEALRSLIEIAKRSAHLTQHGISSCVFINHFKKKYAVLSHPESLY